MTANPERQKIIVWINGSLEPGATKARACRTLGISIRPIQRWSDVDGEVLFGQRPNATRVSPPNKLTQRER
jgi:putative transposase